MLFILLLLHIFWTVIIMKIVVKTVTEGEAGDVRSDSELSDNEEKTKVVKVLILNYLHVVSAFTEDFHCSKTERKCS